MTITSYYQPLGYRNNSHRFSVLRDDIVYFRYNKIEGERQKDYVCKKRAKFMWGRICQIFSVSGYAGGGGGKYLCLELTVFANF